MIKLIPEEFSMAREILGGLDIHLAVNALLDGDSPGDIYLDDKGNPGSLFAKIMKRCFLAGRSDNQAFNQAIKKLFVVDIFPKGIQEGEQDFSLFYSPDEWDMVIGKEILEEIYPNNPHHYYICKKISRNWQAVLPEGYNLVEVDQALIENVQMENHDELIEEIHSECQSVTSFLENRFGFCVFNGNELVNWCLSEHNNGGRCEVGIATVPGHRRKGLATAASLALVEKALGSGYDEIGWHCYAGNKGSIGTALAAGFEKVRQYPAYWVSYDKAIAYGVHGNQQFERQAYQHAVKWYLRAIGEGGAPAWVYWNTACAHANLDQLEQAFDYLNQAIDQGFDDANHIQNSPHLSKWHGTDEWNNVTQRLVGDIPSS